MHARIVQVMLTAVGFIASLPLSTGVHAAVANGLIAYPCETGNPPETHQQNICLIDPAAPNPAATRKQITFDGINALPAWSPDGTMLAYTHLEGNSAEIFVMKISDLSAKPLVPGAAPAWSPDGNRIAFTAPSAIVGGAQEIWAIDLNGANLQQLTKRPAGDVGPGGNSLVTWAPDSQSIAYGYTVQDPNHPVVDKHTTIEVTNLVHTRHPQGLTYVRGWAAVELEFRVLDVDLSHAWYRRRTARRLEAADKKISTQRKLCWRTVLPLRFFGPPATRFHQRRSGGSPEKTDCVTGSIPDASRRRPSGPRAGQSGSARQRPVRLRPDPPSQPDADCLAFLPVFPGSPTG